MSKLIENKSVDENISADSRLENCFYNLSKSNKKALITFITAGDPPGIDTSKLMHSLVNGGADIIEIGVPFSDPAADGEAIQKSSERAIKSGINYNHVFAYVKEFRKVDKTTPVILMGYMNPAETYIDGFSGFCNSAKDSGADGLILVDLSFESGEVYRNIISDSGLELINLITPTTTSTRIKQITEKATGFLYYVSMRGVTGKSSNKLDEQEISKSINDIKQFSSLPVCVGFGIGDAETAKSMSNLSDGIIIGSALVRLLYNEAQNDKNVYDSAMNFVLEIKKAMNL